MERFVKKGDDVIVKPNICVDYHTSEYAATTNPIVVATLVTLAKRAGAKRVRVMDQPFGGTAENAYEKSGIGPAARAAGGVMEIMSPVKYASFGSRRGATSRPGASTATSSRPTSSSTCRSPRTTARHALTLGCKNVLGVVLDAGQIHANIMPAHRRSGQRLPADLDRRRRSADPHIQRSDRRRPVVCREEEHGHRQPGYRRRRRARDVALRARPARHRLHPVRGGDGPRPDLAEEERGPRDLL